MRVERSVEVSLQICKCKAAFTRAPGPKSRFESGSQSTWERWSESGFESSLPPCKCNQSGSESPCKRGLSCMVVYNPRGGGGGGGTPRPYASYGLVWRRHPSFSSFKLRANQITLSSHVIMQYSLRDTPTL